MNCGKPRLRASTAAAGYNKRPVGQQMGTWLVTVRLAGSFSDNEQERHRQQNLEAAQRRLKQQN